MALKKISEGITGQQAADIIFENDRESYINVIDVVPSKNLFNKRDVLIGYYINASTGNIMPSEGWTCSNYIEVTPGSTYTLSGNKERVGLALYNANKTTARYINMNLGSFTTQPGEVFVAFNLASPSITEWSNIQLEAGSVATDYVTHNLVPVDSVEGLRTIATEAKDGFELATELNEKMGAFLIESTDSDNLLNPDNILTGTLVSDTNGSLTSEGAGTNYDTLDYTEIQGGYIYTALNSSGNYLSLRKGAFYDSDHVYISGFDTLSSFVTPANAKYVRVAFSNTGTDYNPRNMGIFLGANPVWTSYQQYYNVKLRDNTKQPSEKEDDEIASISDVKALASSGNNTAKDGIRYLLTDSTITLSNSLGQITGEIGNKRGNDGNDMFNFSSYAFKDVSRAIADDIAPSHSQNTTLGANHGQPHMIATINGHGLDNSVIGTEWTNGSGVKFIILRIVNQNQIAFLSENQGSEASPSFINLTVGNLSRGSSTLTVSAVTSAQLYPSISNLVIDVMKSDGSIVTEGSGSDDYIDVVESYDIMSVDDILTNIKNRAGSNNPPEFNGKQTLHIENIYRFLPNLTVLIFVNVRVMNSVALADIMGAQATLFGVNGQTAYYVPDSLPVNGYDFRKPLVVTWASGVPSIYFGQASWQDPDNPPSRVVEYYNDTAFSIGTLTTRGIGRSLEDFTARTFEIRYNTGKVYPHPVEGTVVGSPVPQDSVFSMVMFRSFSDLTKTRIGNRMSFFNFSLEGVEYVFIDYSGDMLDKIDLGKPVLNGKEVKIVQSSNTELLSDTYNNGIYVKATYVEGSTCSLIATIG